MTYEQYSFPDGSICRIPIPESYRDCIVLIKSDFYRLGQSGSAFWLLLKALRHPYHYCLVWLRLSSYTRGILFPIFKTIKMITHSRRCIDIPFTTRIGFGFYIGHGQSIVINGDTIIGNNVNVGQFLNIGSNNNTPAMIGDNVYVGPMVCIVEDVKIGNNATIGAGSVVISDVSACSTVVGVPAKAICKNNPGQYILNRWNIEK